MWFENAFFFTHSASRQRKLLTDFEKINSFDSFIVFNITKYFHRVSKELIPSVFYYIENVYEKSKSSLLEG